MFTRDELEADGPPLTTKEVGMMMMMIMMMMITSLMMFTQVRLATILRELPFTISFSQRVLVFQNLISRDKQEHQGEMVSFMQGPHINLSIRTAFRNVQSTDYCLSR